MYVWREETWLYECSGLTQETWGRLNLTPGHREQQNHTRGVQSEAHVHLQLGSMLLQPASSTPALRHA